MKHLRPCTTGLALTLLLAGPLCLAQTDPAAPQAEQPKPEPVNPSRSHPVDQRPIKTFFLTNASQPNDGNEILTALRLMLDPSAKLYLVPFENAIMVRDNADQIELAGRLIAELDHPRRSYRLTYTVTESDAGKRVGSQRVAMVLVSGQRSTVKNGSKVPIATGSYSDGSSGAKGQETQFTYLDIGLNFDATLTATGAGAVLSSKVEQSAVAEERSIANVEEPVIRQNVLQGTAALLPGKPVVLGSLDIPGSTRHLDVEVVMEPVN